VILLFLKGHGYEHNDPNPCTAQREQLRELLQFSWLQALASSFVANTENSQEKDQDGAHCRTSSGIVWPQNRFQLEHKALCHQKMDECNSLQRLGNICIKYKVPLAQMIQQSHQPFSSLVRQTTRLELTPN
jgi:hypothetical protein